MATPCGEVGILLSLWPQAAEVQTLQRQERRLRAKATLGGPPGPPPASRLMVFHASAGEDLTQRPRTPRAWARDLPPPRRCRKGGGCSCHHLPRPLQRRRVASLAALPGRHGSRGDPLPRLPNSAPPAKGASMCSPDSASWSRAAVWEGAAAPQTGGSELTDTAGTGAARAGLPASERQLCGR